MQSNLKVILQATIKYQLRHKAISTVIILNKARLIMAGVLFFVGWQR